MAEMAVDETEASPFVCIATLEGGAAAPH